MLPLRRRATIVLVVPLTAAALGCAVTASPRHQRSRRDASVAAATWTDPPANAQFDYQIGGAYPPARTVRIVDRDRTSRPVSGLYNICYVNAFQTQNYQTKWWEAKHPSLLLRYHGKFVHDPGWPGEILFDTSTARKRSAIAAILDKWIDGCEAKGFQAIEPDNLDSNTRSHHLLTTADNMDLATKLAERAHADGLAFGQKNDAELAAKYRKEVGFDFAIAEECQVYNECGYYLRDYGDEVFEIEYTDDGTKYFHAACAARGNRISIILRDRNVVPRGNRHYVYEYC